MNRETVLGRQRTGNFEGIAWQKVSPMKDIEPILAEYLYEMYKMGKAKTKPETFYLPMT
jgi:hypothetical protein